MDEIWIACVKLWAMCYMFEIVRQVEMKNKRVIPSVKNKGRDFPLPPFLKAFTLENL